MAAPAALRPEEALGPGRARLDAFRLPPATMAQFGLLAVLTLFGAAFVTDWFLGRSARWTEEVRVCAIAADNSTMSDVATRARDLLACTDTVGTSRFAAAAVAMLATATAIALVHALAPRVLIHRRALTAPGVGLYPESVAEVRALVGAAGLRRAPALVIDPFREAPAGRVFGAFGRTWLRLNIGVLRGTDGDARARRAAIVRHELAHLVNRDVEIIGLTMAAGRVLVAVLAFFLVASALTAPVLVAQSFAQAALFTVLVVLARVAVVRTREHYADVRATAEDPAPSLVMSAFPEPPAPNPRRFPRRLRLHPSVQARATTVAEPGRLLRLTLVLPLSIGLTAGLVHPSVELALENWLGRWAGNTPQVTGVAVALVLAPPLIAAVWRATLAAVATSVPLPRVLPTAALLALGFLIGGYAMPTTGVGWGSVLALRPGVALVEAGTLFVGFLVVLVWARGAAVAWLGKGDGSGDRRAMRGAQVIGVVLIGVVLGVWYSNLPAGTLIDAATPLVGGMSVTPFGVLAVTAAAAFTVAAGFRRGAARYSRPWATLTPAVLAACAVGLADVLFSHSVVLQAALSAIQGGQQGYVWAYAALAVPMLLAAATAIVVVLVTARGGRAAAPFAHAVLGAAAATIALETVDLGGAMTVFCGQQCVPWNGIGMVSLALNAGATVGATVGLLLVAPLAVPLARAASRRLRPPLPPLRCRRAAVAFAAVLAVLASTSITAAVQSSMWIALPIDNGITMIPAVQALPDADAAGTVSVVDACRLRNVPAALDPETFAAEALVRHAAAAASDSPALAAFGRTAYDVERHGGSGALARDAVAAIETYCNFLAQLALPGGPPDVLPAGFTGTWTGAVTQDGYGPSPFPMTVTITGDAVATVVARAAYPSLGCTVHWTLRSVVNGLVTVREVVESGDACVDADVRLALDPTGRLSYRYDSGGGRAELERTPGR